MERFFIHSCVLLASVLDIHINPVKGDTESVGKQLVTISTTTSSVEFMIVPAEELNRTASKIDKIDSLYEKIKQQATKMNYLIMDSKCNSWRSKLKATMIKISDVGFHLLNPGNTGKNQKNRHMRRLFAQNRWENNVSPAEYALILLQDLENVLLLAAECDETEFYQCIRIEKVDKIFDHIQDFRSIYQRSGEKKIRIKEVINLDKLKRISHLKNIIEIIANSRLL